MSDSIIRRLRTASSPDQNGHMSPTATLTALAADTIERLREALKPFAEFAGDTESMPETSPLFAHFPDELYNSPLPNVASLRQAKKVLEETE